jgi:hypothetical protein
MPGLDPLRFQPNRIGHRHAGRGQQRGYQPSAATESAGSHRSPSIPLRALGEITLLLQALLCFNGLVPWLIPGRSALRA